MKIFMNVVRKYVPKIFLNNVKDKHHLIDEKFKELRTYTSCNKTYTIFDEKILLIVSNNGAELVPFGTLEEISEHFEQIPNYRSENFSILIMDKKNNQYIMNYEGFSDSKIYHLCINGRLILGNNGCYLHNPYGYSEMIFHSDGSITKAHFINGKILDDLQFEVYKSKQNQGI